MERAADISPVGNLLLAIADIEGAFATLIAPSTKADMPLYTDMVPKAKADIVCLCAWV